MNSLTKSDLAQFTGGITFYRHSLMPNIVYTEGIKFMADAGGAYWLVDKIATLQMMEKLKIYYFQSWLLRKVKGTGSAWLSVNCGNQKIKANQTPIHFEKIEFTDFPLDEINVWVVNGTMMLPSEY